MDFLIILILGFAIMWLLLILPQRRRQQSHQRMLESIKPGDYVVTAGGLYGTVTDLGTDDLGLEVAPDVEVRIARRSIGAVVPPDEIEDVDVDEVRAGGDEATAARREAPSDENRG